MAKDFKSLGWDYAVFALFLSFSILAPLWSRIYGKKKQKTKADYVFATGSVSIIAMMLSIARGTLGVRSILGYPSELFYRGSAMWEVIYGMVNAYPIVCFIFIPVYFNLRITSVYQYLDMRFKSRIIRCLASGTFLLRQMLSMGITVYTPGLALYTLLGIPYWASIIGMSLICIFFTVLGGLKAAINADVIQSVTVIAVTLAVIIRGTIEGGGPVNVFNINNDNGRLKFMNFTGDLTVRVDTLSAWLGQLFMSLSQFGCQQNFMQRYVSMKSLKEVTRVMMSNIPLIIIFFSLSWVAGMTIFATYVTCDPMAIGYIRKRDEILPFFIEDKLAFLPGFLGIFMATLFNGALSLNVSNLNSCATVIWEDFISQLPRCRGLNDTQQLTIIKTIAVVVGLIIMGIGFCVGLLTGVIESSMLAFSATCGPLLGVFVLAMLVPIANWKGASVGIIVSHILTIWLTFGGLTMDKKVELLETSTEGCSSYNFSEGISKEDPNIHWTNSNKLHLTNWDNLTVASALPSVAERTPLENMYALSYMYYSVFGAILTIFLGTVISYLTHTEADVYDSNLLHPLVLRISECFPGKKPYRIKAPPAENGTKMAPGRVPDFVENKEKIESIDLSKKLNPPKPTHPDIIDNNQYASKTGTYRKKDENDVV